MRRLLYIFLLLIPFAVKAQVPMPYDTVRYPGFGAAFTPSVVTSTYQGVSLPYIRRGTSSVYDLGVTGKYLRTYYKPKTYVDSLSSLKESLSNKATSFTTVNNTLYPTVQAAKAYMDALVTGLLDDRGSYNASGNVYPSAGGSGTSGTVVKGDIWSISGAGTLGGVAVNVGDWVRATVDAPGQTSTNWAIVEGNLGYTPENLANKQNSLTIDGSGIKYPTVDAVNTGLSGKAPITGSANYINQGISATNQSFNLGTGSGSGMKFTSNINTIGTIGFNAVANPGYNAGYELYTTGSNNEWFIGQRLNSATLRFSQLQAGVHTDALTIDSTRTVRIPILAANGIVTTSSGTGALGVAATTGSGNVVLATSPTLVTPNLGTPSTLVGTNITGTAAGLTAGAANNITAYTINQNLGTANSPTFSNVTASLTGHASLDLPLTGGTITNILKVSATGTGDIRLSSGDGASSGFASFYKSDGTTRLGYIGFSNNSLRYTAEGSAYHEFIGAVATSSTLSVGGNLSAVLPAYSSGTNLPVVYNSTNNRFETGIDIPYRIYMVNSYTSVGTSGTTFTVSIGLTMPDANYNVLTTPKNAATANTNYYITNKTTTSFDIVFSASMAASTASFDWVVCR